jgi:bifunctional DNase/RNase
MDVQVELSRILIRELTDGQLIELREVGGSRSFPIVIGLSEAMAIERRLRGLQVPRPMSHDLLGAVIHTLGARLLRVVIHELNEGTFFAVLVLETADGERLVDSRPSDAIAMAVVDNTPMFVSEDVLDQVQQQDEVTGMDNPLTTPGEFESPDYSSDPFWPGMPDAPESTDEPRDPDDDPDAGPS